MRNFVLVACLVLLSAPAPIVSAQAYPPPTREAGRSTPEQDQMLRAGAQLHDQGKYDEAIAKYEEVLKENPANMTALYELAYSYQAKNDHQHSLEAARRGIVYKSEQLPLFYDLIGAALDATGRPQAAVDAYKKGIEYVPGAAHLYYNLAVTYYESLKKPEEARRALEQAVGIDPTNADTELLLGQIFEAGGYHTPAFLALSKFLVIRPAGEGTLQGYGVWRKILRAGMDPVRGMTPNAGAMRGRAQAPGPTDEGNFADVDRQIAASHLAAQDAMDKGTSEIQALVAQVDSVLAALARRPAGADRSFAATHYVPYFVELKQKNYVEPFVYWISQRAPVPGVREWLDGNEARVREYLQWTLQYKWPKR